MDWMLETCAVYLETGARAAFDNGPPDGVLVAHPDGGVCNGDPACEGSRMTFIGSGPAGAGAVTVAVPGGGLDRPAEAVCGRAAGAKAGDDAVKRAWFDAAVSAGRLVHDGATRGTGCAWNGQVYRFDAQGGPIAAFLFTLKSDAVPCAAPSS